MPETKAAETQIDVLTRGVGSSTVNTDLRQRHLEAYFAENEAIEQGMQGETDPQEIAAALVTFAQSVTKAGLKLQRHEFDRLASEFATTLRINRQQKRALSATESNGAVVRAAIRAGIVDGAAAGLAIHISPGDGEHHRAGGGPPQCRR